VDLGPPLAVATIKRGGVGLTGATGSLLDRSLSGLRDLVDRTLVEVRPFEQLSAERTGLGLGLPISRRGVEANGGTLSVRNLPGTGCVFTIDLPRTA